MKKILKKLFEMKIEIGIGLIIAFIVVSIYSRFYIIGTIPSPSMVPTLNIKDKVFAERKYDSLERGKIYIFSKDKSFLIKRLIGKAGDHILIKDKDVYVNGKLLNEPYVVYNNLVSQTYDIDITIPEEKLFFLGDNRGNSNDGRLWEEKFIDESDVIAKAKAIIYPISKIGTKLN